MRENEIYHEKMENDRWSCTFIFPLKTVHDSEIDLFWRNSKPRWKEHGSYTKTTLIDSNDYKYHTMILYLSCNVYLKYLYVLVGRVFNIWSFDYLIFYLKINLKLREKSVPLLTRQKELTQEIDSNPLSNVSWYDGTELLKTQTFSEIANLTVENALCTDTKNFTLRVSNAVQRNVGSMLELIVNCT